MNEPMTHSISRAIKAKRLRFERINDRRPATRYDKNSGEWPYTALPADQEKRLVALAEQIAALHNIHSHLMAKYPMNP